MGTRATVGVTALAAVRVAIIQCFFLLHLELFRTVSPPAPGDFLMDLSIQCNLLFFALVSLLPLVTAENKVLSTQDTVGGSRRGVMATREAVTRVVKVMKIAGAGSTPLDASPEALLDVTVEVTFAPDPEDVPEKVPVGPEVGPSGDAFLQVYLLIMPASTDVPCVLIFSMVRVTGLLQVAGALTDVAVVVVVATELGVVAFMPSLPP